MFFFFSLSPFFLKLFYLLQEEFRKAILQTGPPENFALQTVQDVIRPQVATPKHWTTCNVIHDINNTSQVGRVLSVNNTSQVNSVLKVLKSDGK